MGDSVFPESTLDDLATFRNGKGLSPDLYSDYGQHPVFGSNGQIARTDNVLNPSPVISIGRVGAYCGSVYAINEPSWVSDNAIVAEPRPDVDFRFLYFILKSLDLNRTAIGSAQPLLTQGGLKIVRSVTPPLPEQKAIARILGALDDKIENNRRMNETLEAMARAIFKSWFVDFDPVRAKAEGRTPDGMDAATAALFPDSFEDSPLGKIPKGWGVMRLPEAVELNPARTLKKGDLAPYLEMGNMPTTSARVLGWKPRPFGSGMRFMNGDVLVARITPCLENGKTAYVDFLDDGTTGWGSTEYIVMSSRPPLSPEFAYFLARTDEFRAHAITNMTGTSGRQRVPATAFDSYQVVVPSAAIAESFGRFAGQCLLTMKQNDLESFILAATRDALLPKLLSGEVRVKEAEGVVGEVG